MGGAGTIPPTRVTKNRKPPRRASYIGRKGHRPTQTQPSARIPTIAIHGSQPRTPRSSSPHPPPRSPYPPRRRRKTPAHRASPYPPAGMPRHRPPLCPGVRFQCSGFRRPLYLKPARRRRVRLRRKTRNLKPHCSTTHGAENVAAIPRHPLSSVGHSPQRNTENAEPPLSPPSGCFCLFVLFRAPVRPRAHGRVVSW
jgi:hypothetical protein